MDKRLVKAGIVNESHTQVERLAAKILSLPGGSSTFIKTFALPTHPQNIKFANKLKNALSFSNGGHLGISVSVYAGFNSIDFYSAMKEFPLQKGDEIILEFEDDERLQFVFTAINKTAGYMKRNNCLVPDAVLQHLATKRLKYWIVKNAKTNLEIVGGFDTNDHNKQYGSKKAGQQLLMSAMSEVLLLKHHLKSL